jgi:hypothetical protein
MLRAAGHTVVGTSSSLKDASRDIPNLAKKDVGIVIMDGDLSGGNNTDDGESLSEDIRKQHGNKVIIIGHAQSKDIINAHSNCPKVEGVTNLVKTVTEV